MDVSNGRCVFIFIETAVKTQKLEILTAYSNGQMSYANRRFVGIQPIEL